MHKSLVLLHDYWLSKCRGDRLPAKADIDPIELRDALPDICLYDVLDGGADFRIRLAGTRLEQVHGRSLKGVVLSSYIEPAKFVDVAKRFNEAIASRGPSYFKGPTYFLSRDFTTFERILLPLADDGVTVDRLIAAIVYEVEDPGPRPILRGSPTR